MAAKIMDEEDCSALNELRTANSRAVNELIFYANKTGVTDIELYRKLLADAERTWADFNDFARQFLKIH